MTDEIETEFRTAVEAARDALEHFNAEPLIASKRGGPRLSPWWRVWVQASEVAQRWHRQLSPAQRGPSPDYEPDPDLEYAIDRMLAEGAARRSDPNGSAA